ncbi:hypothetical protein P0Y43_09800 [Pseudomonas entomophila]|uniref:hypothetical protein n=1 Tax=Pseudomonas entomophila TaxID=312306 RepID=UPI0023D80323|nr:hypothetical protein [Pseudomonas entomophila]MDF0731016.1 hypothetical protein [Pseudomonas entomophila]
MDYLMENWQIILFFWFWCGAICAYVAAGKSRSAYAWFVIGFVFPIVGIIALVLLGRPEKALDARSKEVAIEIGESADYRKCPFCAEAIRKEAVKCRCCHSDVPPLESSSI